MNRFWSILFLLVPFMAIVTFVMAANDVVPFDSTWLPTSISSSGDSIDRLFNGILLLAGVTLVAAIGAIGIAIWKFDHRRNSAPATYVQGSLGLEIAWTIIPAVIILLLAYLQMSSWATAKIDRPVINIDGQTFPLPPMVLVKAKQFGWEFYYAGEDGIVATQDDVFIENLLVLPAGEDVVLQLESRDVIHSFFVPELRLKQDLVPGMIQFTWFNSRETAEVEIVCTEFCGWGHYLMKADLRFVERPEFDRWLAEQKSSYRPEFESPLDKEAAIETGHGQSVPIGPLVQDSLARDDATDQRRSPVASSSRIGQEQ